MELATAPVSTVVSEGYREFAQKVGPHKYFRPWNTRTGISLAFDFPTAAKLKRFQQRATWRFHSQLDRDLSLEVVKDDEYETVQNMPAASRRLLRTRWEAKIDHRRFGAQLGEFSSLTTEDAQLLKAKTANFFPGHRDSTKPESVLQSFVRMMRFVVDELSQVQLA